MFDAGAKMSAVAALAGVQKSGDTAIQSLGAALHIAAQGDRIDDLHLVVPNIGTLTGSGTISPNGGMDFAMLVKLSASSGTAESVVRAASLGQRSSGVPFRIQGTTSNPVFVPDVSRAVKTALTSEETQKKAADVIGKLVTKDDLRARPGFLVMEADAVIGGDVWHRELSQQASRPS